MDTKLLRKPCLTVGTETSESFARSRARRTPAFFRGKNRLRYHWEGSGDLFAPGDTRPRRWFMNLWRLLQKLCFQWAAVFFIPPPATLGYFLDTCIQSKTKNQCARVNIIVLIVQIHCLALILFCCVEFLTGLRVCCAAAHVCSARHITSYKKGVRPQTTTITMNNCFAVLHTFNHDS